MNILISGSRHWSKANMQLDTAHTICKRLVLRASDIDAHIIVGDNPFGVDATVIDYCMLYSVSFMCYGIHVRPRLIGTTPYIQVDSIYRTYAKRDEYMVLLADKVMCVWNGASPGTKHVYDYALQEAKLWNLTNVS